MIVQNSTTIIDNVLSLELGLDNISSIKNSNIELLNKYDLIENTFEKIIKKLSVDKKVVIFGAHLQGSNLLKLLHEIDIMPCMFCDNFSDKTEFGYDDFLLPVVRPNVLFDLEEDFCIIIASSMYMEILSQLESMGLGECVVSGDSCSYKP